MIWPAAWRAVWRRKGELGDAGVRICLIWFAGGFLVFSAISGKQPHYLVPEIPALGLLLAFALLRATAETESCFWRPLDRIIPAGLFFAVAAAIAAAPRKKTPSRPNFGHMSYDFEYVVRFCTVFVVFDVFDVFKGR